MPLPLKVTPVFPPIIIIDPLPPIYSDDYDNDGNIHDNVSLTDYNDVAYVGAGDDVVRALGGFDVVHGGDGNDTIYGGGRRIILAEEFVQAADKSLDVKLPDIVIDPIPTLLHDYLYGDDGDDILIGGVSADFLFGGSGDDLLQGSQGSDTLYGESGDDLIVDGEGSSFIDGGAGRDTLAISSALGAVVNLRTGKADGADSGHDTLISIENVRGHIGQDLLTGNDARNRLDGGAGNDVLKGEGGSDRLEGNEGADTLHGGKGIDFLTGDQGADTLIAGVKLALGLEGDWLDGGSGHDTADYSYAGFSLIVDLQAETAKDADGDTDHLFDIERVNGGSKNDTLRGSADANRLTGYDGNDVLSGRAGNDTLSGGTGADKLTGDTGKDVLKGGAGADVLIGGLGADSLFGGTGADIFRYGSVASSTKVGGAFDVIHDFAAGDRLDFTGIASRFSDVTVSTSAGFTHLSVGTTDFRLDVEGIHTFDAGDFIFG